MGVYNTFSIVIVLAAFIAWLNQRVLKLPNAIGVMLIAILVSLILMFVGDYVPKLLEEPVKLLDSVDFSNVMIGVLLNFLLFAGRIGIRLQDLRSQKVTVITFSTLSVVISTFIVGGGLYWLLPLLSLKASFLSCLLFGSLISPTDPVAVLAILKEGGLSRKLETKIAGESIFNDGMAIVIFFTVLHAIHNPDEGVTWSGIVKVFVHEALGGLALGAVLGFVAMRTLKNINQYSVEVMITLALVLGGSLLARTLGVSPPLTMVTAGIVTGNFSRRMALSEESRDYVDKFWELIEEILNVILFVLIGLELLVIRHDSAFWTVSLICVPMLLGARFLSLWLPGLFIRLQEKLSNKTIRFLTWGGLRGGISIALALSLPHYLHKDLFVFITYIVVVFSVLVQGLSIHRFAQRNRTHEHAVIE